MYRLVSGKALVLVALLLLVSSAFAEVSSSEAANYIVSENLVEPGESYVEPGNTITYQKNDYWVFTVKRGSDVTAFIPVSAEDKRVPDSRSTLLALSEAQHVFDSINSLQQTMISRGDWLITAQEETYYDNLQIFLSDELFELEVIGRDSADAEVSSHVADVSFKIKEMIDLSSAIEEEISSVLGFEAELRKKPGASDIKKLDNVYNPVFDKIVSLADKATEYDSETKKLKQAISETVLESQQKSFLISYASPPSQIYVLTSKKTKANALKQEIKRVYENQFISNLVDNLGVRFEGAAADKALTGFDEELNTKGFSSLEEAYNYITNELYVDLWADTDALVGLQTSYSMARNFYEDKNYTASIESSGKAKRDALKVLSAGQREPEAEVNVELVKTLIYVLAALIVLGIAYRYREEIRGMFYREEKKEEEGYKIDWK